MGGALALGSSSSQSSEIIAQRYFPASTRNPGDYGCGVNLTDLLNLLKRVVELDLNVPTSPLDGTTRESFKLYSHRTDHLHSLNAGTTIRTRNLVPGLHTLFGFEWTSTERSTEDTLQFSYEFVRDLGLRTYLVIRPTSNYLAFLAENRDLPPDQFVLKHRSQYGSHYIAGDRKVAMLSVKFTRHFASDSSSLNRSAYLRAKYGSFVNAQGDFSEIVQDISTTETLEYEILTTETSGLPLPKVGEIKSRAEVDTFLNTCRAFVGQMTSYNASEFVLERIDRLSEYEGPSLSESFIVGEYDRFDTNFKNILHEVLKLRRWESDPSLPFWLSASGFQYLRQTENEVTEHLLELEKLAEAHFRQGAELRVPAKSETVLDLARSVPRPVVKMLLRRVAHDAGIYIGCVLYPSMFHLRATPHPEDVEFTRFTHDTRVHLSSRLQVYTNAEQFENQVITELQKTVWGPVVDAYLNGFRTNSAWLELKSAASNCPVGFFGFGMSRVTEGAPPAGEDGYISVVDVRGEVVASAKIDRTVPLNCDPSSVQADLAVEVGIMVRGPIGSSYRIERAPKVDPGAWTDLGVVTLSEPEEWFRYSPEEGNQYFFRATRIK